MPPLELLNTKFSQHMTTWTNVEKIHNVDANTLVAIVFVLFKGQSNFVKICCLVIISIVVFNPFKNR